MVLHGSSGRARLALLLLALAKMNMHWSRDQLAYLFALNSEDPYYGLSAATGLTAGEYGLLVGWGFGWVYMVSELVMGRVADLHNRVLLVGLGQLIWSAATILTSLSQNFTWLLFARIIMGLGQGLAGPSSCSLITDLFPPGICAEALGIFGIGEYVGGGAAALSLSTASVIGWRNTCRLTAVVGALQSLALLATVAEPVRNGGGDRRQSAAAAKEVEVELEVAEADTPGSSAAAPAHGGSLGSTPHSGAGRERSASSLRRALLQQHFEGGEGWDHHHHRQQQQQQGERRHPAPPLVLPSPVAVSAPKLLADGSAVAAEAQLELQLEFEVGGGVAAPGGAHHITLGQALCEVVSRRLVVAILAASAVRFIPAYSKSYFLPLFFSVRYPSLVKTYTYLNASVLAVVGAASGYWGGRAADAWDRAGEKRARLLVPCIGAAGAVPMIALALYAPAFGWSILGLVLEYGIAEVWLGPCLSALLAALPTAVRGVGAGSFTFVTAFVGGAAALSVGALVTGTDSAPAVARVLMTSCAIGYGSTAALFFFAATLHARQLREQRAAPALLAATPVST